VQSSSQINTASKPTPGFLQAGCPSFHPTNSVNEMTKQYYALTHNKLAFTSSDLTLLPVIGRGIWPAEKSRSNNPKCFPRLLVIVNKPW